VGRRKKKQNFITKTTKIIIGVIIAIIIIGGIWYGVSRKPTPKEEEMIKIGVLADLSGDYVSLLRGVPRGVELAKEDLEKETGRKIQLIIEDQKSCDSKETVTIMNKFVSIDKVDAVIGGTCSNTTLAAAPIANQNKIIMISPASSAPTISQAGEYVFRTYISDLLRAKEAAKIAYELGKRRMAIFTDVSNDAMIELAKGGREKFTELGGVIVVEEEITKESKDFRTQIAKIKNSSPDCLYLSITGPNQIALIAKQVKELGMDVQLIVPHETVEDPNVIQIAGKTIEGLIYVMPSNPNETPNYQELKRRYKEKYGEEEMPSYVTESYDAVVLAVKAVLASNGKREDIKNKLFEVSKTYQGVSGNVVFDENGDVTKPVMFKIENSQFVPYGE